MYILLTVRRFRLLALPFVVFAGGSCWAAAINNTPNLPVAAQGTAFIEQFGSGDAVFTVTNNTGVPLILDYALAIIVQTGGDADDLVQFGGVTADTEIGIGGIGTYAYHIINPNGNPFEPEDNGRDNVYFWVEFSDATGFGPNPTPVINVKGEGLFFFAGPMGPNAPPLEPAVYNALTGCANDPNPTVGNCAPAMALYPNSFSPPLNEFPATAEVRVFDVPEPAMFLPILGALSLLGAAGWRSRLAQRGRIWRAC